MNDKVRGVDKPELSSSEDITRSLVYNHLKKVSPKLAEKFSCKFTFARSSLVLESVMESFYQEITASTEVNDDCTDRKYVRKTNLRKKAKRFTSQEDELIRAAMNKEGKVDFVALGMKLNRGCACATLRGRAELLETTSNVKKRGNFTFTEDQILIETVVLPRLGSEKLSSIHFKGHELKPLVKQLVKSKGAIRARWDQSLQPWLLQHYLGTLDLRVERMLANLIAETYSEFNQIDWKKVAVRKEFIGHTETSLRGLYFKKLRSSAKKKLQLPYEDVNLHHIVEYCNLVHVEEAQGQSKARLNKDKIQRQRDVITFFEEKVTEKGIKDFL